MVLGFLPFSREFGHNAALLAELLSFDFAKGGSNYDVGGGGG